MCGCGVQHVYNRYRSPPHSEHESVATKTIVSFRSEPPGSPWRARHRVGTLAHQPPLPLSRLLSITYECAPIQSFPIAQKRSQRFIFVDVTLHRGTSSDAARTIQHFPPLKSRMRIIDPDTSPRNEDPRSVPLRALPNRSMTHVVKYPAMTTQHIHHRPLLRLGPSINSLDGRAPVSCFLLA